jgi:hypothetical protein
MACEQGTAVAVCVDQCHARGKQGTVGGGRVRAKSKHPWRHMRKDHRLEKEVYLETYLDDLIY